MKKYVLHLFFVTTLIFFSYLGGLLILDPYRIFHNPWVRSGYYVSSDLDVQAAGIINQNGFDAIILGTSMAENFSPNEASTVFDKKFVNISLSGATAGERSVVLNYALNKRKISTVIYSLDADAFNQSSLGRMERYRYLYDSNPWNDLRLYISSSKYSNYFFCGNAVFKARCTYARDLEHLTAWYLTEANSKRFGGLDKWFLAQNDRLTMNALNELSMSIANIESGKIEAVDNVQLKSTVANNLKNFNHYILRFARENRGTDFYLFFPPYSRLKYAIWAQGNPYAFAKYIETLRLIVEECSKYENIKVFGFETATFLNDIANYKDTSHYHQRFNSVMLSWMKGGEYELSSDNIESYILEIRSLALSYAVSDIGSQIDHYLKTKKYIK